MIPALTASAYAFVKCKGGHCGTYKIEDMECIQDGSLHHD
jgi:hypothetical protein